MTPPTDRSISDCEHAVRQLWDYLDGRLPADAREWVAEHLAGCAGCTSHFVFEQSFLDSLRTLRRDDSEFDALRERVRGVLRAGSADQHD